MRRPAVFVVAVISTVALAGCDWTMFRAGPARTGFTADSSISLQAVVSGSPNRAWSGITTRFVYSSPAVAQGVVYVGADDQTLYAFDASGTTNCSGSPKTCGPLWTAPTGGSVNSSSPAVVDGVVYLGSGDGKLYAFDASGTTNCSGSPKTCAPLWTALTGGGVFSSPAVINGVVYVGSDDQNLYAFDASGTTNCSGSPKTCAPLWTATTGGAVRSSPAVADGLVYVGSFDAKLYVFDASGTTNCSGTPKTCAPLWTAVTANGIGSAPAVADGKVYVTSGNLSPPAGALYAFDAAGEKNCHGHPKVCKALWTATTAREPSSPAVANGVVYAGAFGGPLSAFDGAGSTGCSGGATKTCVPLWTGAMGPVSQNSSPAVANGVVYIGEGGSRSIGDLLAFDATGTTNCSGTPKTCTPIFRSDNLFAPIASSPAVADGFVYVGGSLNGIAAFHFG